jgi:hypothetical protein
VRQFYVQSGRWCDGKYGFGKSAIRDMYRMCCRFYDVCFLRNEENG